MADFNLLKVLKKLLNETKLEKDWITVQKILMKFNYSLNNISKIENEIIEVLKKKFKKIDSTKVIEIEDILDKSLNPDLKSNYLFNIETILKIVEEVVNIILHNI